MTRVWGEQEEKERVTKLEARIMAVTGGRGGREAVAEGKDSSSLVNELLRQRDELHINLYLPFLAFLPSPRTHACTLPLALSALFPPCVSQSHTRAQTSIHVLCFLFWFWLFG